MSLTEELAALDEDVTIVDSRKEYESRQSPSMQEITTRQRPKIPYQPFPVHCLPKLLMQYVIGAAKSIGCDPSFVVLPLLSVLATCIGRSRQVEIKPGWWEPSILWTACVGESASGKSPAFKTILGPFRHLEDAMIEEYQVDCDRILTTHTELNSSKKKSEQTEPQLPPMPRYSTSDCTIEALASILADNHLGLLVADDELSGWLASFNQYKSGKGGDRSKWLQTYDRGRLTIDRKTGIRLTIVPHASVSICGGIQPGILQKSLSVEDYDSGLMARFIMAMPPDQVMGWSDTSMPHPDKLQNCLKALLDCRHEEKTISLDTEAQSLFAELKQTDVTRLQGISGPLRSAWAKSAARAARIALILNCVESPHAEFINADEMRRAIEIVQWADRETERIYQSFGVASSPDAELLEFVQELEVVTPRDLQQWKRKRFPTADVAELELMRLTDAGLLTRNVKTNPGPGRPSTEFLYNSPDTEHRNA